MLSFTDVSVDDIMSDTNLYNFIWADSIARVRMYKYRCSRCGEKYPTSEALINHNARSHVRSVENIKNVKNVESVESVENIKCFKCTQCEKIFESRFGLNKHMSKTHIGRSIDTSDDIRGDIIRSENIGDHIRDNVRSDIVMSDDVRDDKSDGVKSIKREDIVTYECSICYKRYTTKNRLNAHYNANHK